MTTTGITEPLSFDSDVPVYEQIKNRLKLAIARGAWSGGDQLPSVRVLASSLLVNPNTVIRVYRELEQEQVITTHPGKGVFVAPAAQRRCRKERIAMVEEKLGEAIGLAKRAEVADAELDALWERLRAEGRA